MTKTCTKCRLEKDLSLFKVDKKRKDGRSSWCKSCHSISSCKYQKENREKANKNNKKYKRTNKGKDSTKKYKSSDACVKARRRYNSSEIGKAAQARWRYNREQNNSKVLNDLTAREWKEILLSQNNKCKFCGKNFSNLKIKDRAERDHIIPLSKGGSLTKSNVQALCRVCNAKKSNKCLEGFYEQ